MVYHFIAVYSNYAVGRRYGWHYASKERLEKGKIQLLMKKVEQSGGEIQLGIHKLSTNSLKWESVIEKDSFFEDIIVTENMKTFIQQITSDRKLSAYDVAKFILSVIPVSHLKLQKLLYYCYAEYMVKTGNKLFTDNIVAFKYGPVVEDVFYKYKHNGSSAIDYTEDGEFYIHGAIQAATPSFIRMISAEDGIEAARCVADVLKKYIEYSAEELVNRTHLPGGPWDLVYKPGRNCEITDEIIKNFHHIVE
ncbi:Panacea domain-containing protein [Paenibacillus hunanensis]|uniref:Phage-associated protein n=1 Tax=Paenibacillus hunanensis TaxID=539262 RepID=A0ABU1IV83_9BACL|nr:type II toxin-antitoxin system antitoxin SocA domain-containing protein [Paenibacillus hunanensis]MDR6243126.1 putative phage-associated protein [Paenibacillus hunanensis]GGJ11611.1 hypothetical protein GCM10008022_20990 [Paenibacillus hunanensis]